MKLLKQFLFITVMIISFSIATSAQSDQDGKKDPPPKKPRVIVVGEKPLPPKPPKDDDDKKKPMAYLNGFLENKPILYV